MKSNLSCSARTGAPLDISDYPLSGPGYTVIDRSETDCRGREVVNLHTSRWIGVAGRMSCSTR
jgi:hypothetical protein